MNSNIPRVWCVYKHPSDYPTSYVAREWIGEKATGSLVIASTLELLREHLMAMGLGCPIPRWANDDPCIVEVWL